MKIYQKFLNHFYLFNRIDYFLYENKKNLDLEIRIIFCLTTCRKPLFQNLKLILFLIFENFKEANYWFLIIFCIKNLIENAVY